MEKIIYRAKGRGYVACIVAVCALLAALLAVSIWLFVASRIVIAAILLIIAAVGAVWTVIEVCFYKLVLTDERIVLSENRFLASVRQEKVELKYDGLCELKQTSVACKDYKTSPAIALFYSDGDFRFLNVKRFSQVQIDMIISDIKRLAEAGLGREVSVLKHKKGEGFAILY